jgi:hypothetical protein
MPTVDDILRVEKFKIDNFMRMGYSVYDSISAVEEGIDWHDVEDLIAEGCNKELALKVA